MLNSKSESLGIPPLKTENRMSITDKDKAETLNSHFFSVFTHEQKPLPQIGLSPFTSIEDLLFSPDGVAKQLAQLNPHKACGPDKLPARVLKEISQTASTWLAFIFQQSFDLNVVPSDWSKALITAVFKKENKSDPSNYRPISLTSICCKVMEHIVLSHMAKHLSSNNILINEQHGFRQRFSCETQLISAIHDWAKSINTCSQTDVILLDFSKAFDSVPHQRLTVTELRLWSILSMATVVKTPLRSLGRQTTPDSKHMQTLFPMSVNNSNTLSCRIDNPRL